MPRGGARNGAGRKRKPTTEQQAVFRDVVLGSVTPDRWAMVIVKALEQAESGEAVARSWLGSYLMGAPPREVSGTVDGDGRFLFVIE
jgi:hypothetical protein